MDDLIQTLDRMQIKPIGLESANRRYSEHRVVAPLTETSDETRATQAGRPISVDALRAELDPASRSAEKEYQLVPGDRVVIRYLDLEPSRPEFLVISDTAAVQA
jgi:hypothetical protein